LTGPAVTTAPVFSGFKSGLELAWLVILCVLVIAASYFVTRFIGGRQAKLRKKNSNFELLDACSLGSNKYLQIVKIGEKYIVISVTKDSISYITEVSREDLVLMGDGSQGNAFGDLLLKLTGRKKKDNTEDGSATHIDDDNMTE